MTPSAECHTDHRHVQCISVSTSYPSKGKEALHGISCNLQIAQVRVTSRRAYNRCLKSLASQRTQMQMCYRTTSRLPFCKPLNKSSDSPQTETRIGSTRTTKKSRSCWQERDQHTWPTWLICSDRRKRQPFALHTVSFSKTFWNVQNEWWTHLAVPLVTSGDSIKIYTAHPTGPRAPYAVQMVGTAHWHGLHPQPPVWALPHPLQC